MKAEKKLFGGIYQNRANGQLYWLYRWTVNGKRSARSLGSCDEVSRNDAIRRARQIDLQLALGRTPPSQSTPRLGEWCDKFKARKKARVKESTYLEIQTSLKYLTEKLDERTRLDKVTTDDAADWVTWLLDERKLTQSTVHKHVVTVKELFRTAVDEDLISKSPFRAVRSSKPRVQVEATYVKLSDLDRLMDACPDDRWRCLFALCRLAGLRRNEALRLRWIDVDFDQREMRVLPEENDRGQRVEGTKMSARNVPIVPKLYGVLVRAASESEHALVCGGMHPETKATKRIQAKARVKYNAPFQTLRRNCENDWKAKYPAPNVNYWIGHTGQVAQRHYDYPTPSQFDDITQRKKDEKKNGEPQSAGAQ